MGSRDSKDLKVLKENLNHRFKRLKRLKRVLSTKDFKYSKDSIAFQSWVQKTQLLLGSKDSKE